MKSLLPFDELNAMVAASVLKAQSVQDVKDDMMSILVNSYKDGVDAVGEMLEMDLMYDTTSMGDMIFKSIAGKTVSDRLDERINSGDIPGLILLMDSETHRVFNGAEQDAATQSGLKLMKTWVTKRDDRVRDTHEYLEGVTIPSDQEFFTFDGDHAYYPGGFTDAANNCNCRCVLEYTRVSEDDKTQSQERR